MSMWLLMSMSSGWKEMVKRVTIVKMRMYERCGNSGDGSEAESAPYAAEVTNVVMASAG